MNNFEEYKVKDGYTPIQMIPVDYQLLQWDLNHTNGWLNFSFFIFLIFNIELNVCASKYARTHKDDRKNLIIHGHIHFDQYPQNYS